MSETKKIVNRWLYTLLTCMFFLSFSSVASAQVVRYVHTDGLGSTSVLTDTNRNVIERREYEPYGANLGSPTDGVGYTGHVMDAATGLTYMQQRYYDPSIGKFLSIDPVTAYNSGNWRQFNRYAYGFNNPYKFTDPDGREVVIPWVAVRNIAARRTAQAAIASQLEGPLPGPGDAIAVAMLVSMVGEAGYKIYQANQEPTPQEAAQGVVEGIREGKPPVPGIAGERGELLGDADQADADWKKLATSLGAIQKDENNVVLGDGSHANRHSSTRPYPDGPPAGTDTIKHYPIDGSTPSTTIRYPEKEESK